MSNAQTVEAFYESERRRDIGTWVRFWHPDGKQTFPFAADRSVLGISELEAVTREKFRVRPPYGIHTTIEPFADEQRVLARLLLTFSDKPDTHIWCIFHFDDAGLVTEVEEMLDTASA
jgi:hypothetical protein